MKSNKLLFNNTYTSGTVTFLILQERDKFIGICMEFDLEVEGKTAKEAKEKLDDLTHAWLENVVENKLSEELLNKSAPKPYWDILKEAKERVKKREKISVRVVKSSQIPILSQFQFYSTHSPLAFL